MGCAFGDYLSACMNAPVEVRLLGPTWWNTGCTRDEHGGQATTETTWHRKRRTFTITDEAYERLSAQAKDADTNRSRLLEGFIEAQVCLRLDDSDLTLLQSAADGENLDLPAWMRKTALEAMEPAPPAQVFIQLDDSDLTLLREVAEADNLDVSAWVKKAALDAAAPPMVGWSTVEVSTTRPFWWRILPPFIRPGRSKEQGVEPALPEAADGPSAGRARYGQQNVPDARYENLLVQERKTRPGYGNRYSQDAATQPRGESLLPGCAGHFPPAEPGCEQRGRQREHQQNGPVVEDYEEKGFQHGDLPRSQRMFAPRLKDELQGRRRQGFGVRVHAGLYRGGRQHRMSMLAFCTSARGLGRQ